MDDGEEGGFHFSGLREEGKATFISGPRGSLASAPSDLNESLFGCVFVGICRFPFDNSRALSLTICTLTPSVNEEPCWDAYFINLHSLLFMLNLHFTCIKCEKPNTSKCLIIRQVSTHKCLFKHYLL